MTQLDKIPPGTGSANAPAVTIVHFADKKDSKDNKKEDTQHGK